MRGKGFLSPFGNCSRNLASNSTEFNAFRTLSSPSSLRYFAYSTSIRPTAFFTFPAESLAIRGIIEMISSVSLQQV